MKTKRTKKKGFVLIKIGLLLIVAALCLTGYNIWDEQRAARSVSALSEQLLDELDKNSVSEMAAYELNPEMEMPTKNIDGYDYIGMLEIPSYGMKLPVISEWSYPALKLAPCRYSGSGYLDNMVIAAHNYNSHFACLKNLQEGDCILFTDIDGNEFQYEVAVCETLMPTDVEEMKDGDWALTLFTCTLDGQYRVVVRCEKIE